MYARTLGVTQKSKTLPLSFTRVSAKNVLQFNYLSISEPFSIVDTIVGFFKSQIFQKGIFWVVDQKRSHGHSLLSGDTQAGRLYWAESQQLTINPTASRYKQHFGFRQSHWWTDYFLSYELLSFWSDPPQSNSQLIWNCHNFYNQFLDKVYINVKFIYQMFTRWRFRLATEFVKWMYCCVVWTMDIRPESCKRNRWFPCVGIFPNITLGKPFLILGGNMLS